MEIAVPSLACSTRGVWSRVGGSRAALVWIAEQGVRRVVLDVTERELRPRLLDRGSRRELGALLGRLELVAEGLDLLIPAEHFEAGATADRAVGAVVDAIGLAAELRSQEVGPERPVVCVTMGSEPVAGVLESIRAASERDGVRVALLGGPEDAGCVALELGPLARSGVDAAGRVAELGSRVCEVRVDRFDRRTLGEVPASVAAMSVAAPAGVGVADLTDCADPARALAACVASWRGPTI